MREKLTLGIYMAGLIILAVITTLSYNGSEDMSEIENPTESYISFFNYAKDKVIDVHITLPQESWINMLVTAHTRQFYGINAEIDGTAFNSVGFRIMGNLFSSNPQSQTRYSFKIQFNRYINGHSFYGIDELNLRNQFGDPSFMREYLMLEAMRESGMAVPLAMYVNLYINGQLQGLYLAVEAIDNSFLTRNFGDALGNLYRGENHATMLTDMHSEAFSHKKGDDIEQTELAYLIKVLNNLQFGKGEIESVLDVDSVLRYIAANTVFGNYGSYLGRNAQDYYLYRNPYTGIFTIFPHDVKTAFGAYRHDYGRSTDIPVTRPLLDSTFTDRPLVGKLLAVDEYRDKYTEYVNEFIGYLKNVELRIGELDEILSPYVEADPTKFYTTEHYKANINGTGNMSILTYARKRLEFLERQ